MKDQFPRLSRSQRVAFHRLVSRFDHHGLGVVQGCIVGEFCLIDRHRELHRLLGMIRFDIRCILQGLQWSFPKCAAGTAGVRSIVSGVESVICYPFTIDFVHVLKFRPKSGALIFLLWPVAWISRFGTITTGDGCLLCSLIVVRSFGY